MTLAVPKGKWPAFKKIMDRHDVEATRIGMFTKSGKCIVRYRGKTVMDMSLKFLHDGRPIMHQRTKLTNTVRSDLTVSRDVDLKKTLLDILARPNVGSTAFISEQYDFEVQGTSVTKPLHGRGRVNADSAVLQPLPDSSRGIILAHGYCPWYSAIPTLLVSALGIIPDVARAMTIDWKCTGDVLYLVGETNDELGASEYAAMLGLSGGHAPKVNVKRNAKVYDAIVKANAQGLVASILGVGRGGLGVALAKQSIAGQMGARVDLSRIPGKARQSDAILFSESQGRILVSVRSTCEKAFEKLLKGIPHARIGEESGTDLSIELPGARVDVPCPSLTDAYRSYFKEW